ncbi:MAG: RNA pseudouridine synthase [Deltaproteobacteria bacterium]|nr:RNA pseudouridine synthase [Deltaproteobacteria bacterium]
MTDVLVAERGPGWVVAWKPAGLPTDADPARTPCSFRTALAAALELPFRACHPHTRLDVPVAGLTLWSLDADTRRAFLDATRRGELRKLYLALCGRPPAAGGPRRDVPARAPWRTRAGRPLPTPPETRLAVLESGPAAALVAAGIAAGRWHQIRLHLAAAGAPVLGDRRHGGATRVVRADGAVLAAPAVALEAVALELPDGPRRRRIASPPRGFLREALAWSGLATVLDEAQLERAWTAAWPDPLPPST